LDCSHNLRRYRNEIYKLQEKYEVSDLQRNRLSYKNAELLDANLKLREENEDLKTGLENVRCKQSSELQIALERIKTPSDQHLQTLYSRYRSNTDFELHYHDPSHLNNSFCQRLP
jgi:hypothetical protein